jgi:ubiquinone/menaquinone biosynthesis C-methylase UbiE
MNDIRNDPKYLKDKQYKQAGRLNIRINLHKKFSTNTNDWHEWVFSHFDLKPGMKVLEVGCGPATLWQANSQFIPKAVNAYLSDFSFGMVRTSSQKDLPRESIKFLNCEAQAIPFPEGYFDIVIANHMLYHVPDLQLTLREILRVLKKSGTLFAATNGKKHMIEIYDLIKKLIPETEKVKPVSLNFNLENGKDILRDYFSEVDCIIYPDSLEVTEVQPLVDYINSFWDRIIDQNQLITCAAEVERIIKQERVFHIQKSTGLFVAKNA